MDLGRLFHDFMRVMVTFVMGGAGMELLLFHRMTGTLGSHKGRVMQPYRQHRSKVSGPVVTSAQMQWMKVDPF